MKKWFFVVLCGFLVRAAQGQELFVNTEPASNMATHSVGFRLKTDLYIQNGILKSQINPEIMYGASSKWMVHINTYLNNWYSPQYELRGVNLYAKYRFFSKDKPQEHFRMAAFGRVSADFKPGYSAEADVEGDYNGLNAGVVATQLLHRLAISASVAYTRILPNVNDYLSRGYGNDFTLSAGYLVLPKTYTSYKETNMNLYLEFLGRTQKTMMKGMSGMEDLTQQTYYLDAAPGLQFIFQSRARLDLSYRTQMIENMGRNYHSLFFMRLEYNIFGVGTPKF